MRKNLIQHNRIGTKIGIIQGKKNCFINFNLNPQEDCNTPRDYEDKPKTDPLYVRRINRIY